MNAEFWLNALKNNWYLVVALAVCIGAFTYKAMVASGERPAENRPAVSAKFASPQTGLETLQRTMPSSRQRALETIQKHQERYEANPQADEAPGLLLAVGNLYGQKLGAYEEAARHYEIVANDFPERPEARTALIQLATCYERMEDRGNARRVYRQMMDRFPEDSQEYQYAQTMTYKGSIPQE